MLPQPSFSIELNSSEGFRLLGTSWSRSYRSVAIHFETQASESLCGIASLVAIFNAMTVSPTPVDPTYAPYAYWTQMTIVNDSCVSTVHDPNYGSTRSQLAAIVKACYPIDILNVSSPSSLAEARRVMTDALQENASTHVIANFDRQGLNQTGGGHFSPIVAYHPEHDLVLMLDVAKYKYPPLWLPLADLWKAMSTIDPIAGASRGLLVLDRPHL